MVVLVPPELGNGVKLLWRRPSEEILLTAQGDGAVDMIDVGIEPAEFPLAFGPVAAQAIIARVFTTSRK
jgi:hypothetical protein